MQKISAGSFILNPPSSFTSFDHLVGALLENPRHIETECFGGLEVDRQLELDWCLDGKLARLVALEDAIDIGCRLPYLIERVTSVGQQAADLSEVTERIDGREAVASRQQGDLGAMAGREVIRHHDQTTIRLSGLCGNDRFEHGRIANRCHDRLHAEGLLASMVTPVTLPPGRLRLATRPIFTGSLPAVKTIGMVVVAALAASAEAVPPVAAITATLRRTSSAASTGSRLAWFSAHRYSIATLWPSL